MVRHNNQFFKKVFAYLNLALGSEKLWFLIFILIIICTHRTNMHFILGKKSTLIAELKFNIVKNVKAQGTDNPPDFEDICDFWH